MNGERNMLKKIKNKKLRFVVITLLGVTALLYFYSGIDSLFNLLKITRFENYFYVGYAFGILSVFVYSKIIQRGFD